MTAGFEALRNKTALITGAGAGLGRALAVEATRRGMAVALVGRHADRLAETEALLRPGAGRLVIFGDVTDGETRRRLAGRLARQWGRLDVLVNNAAIIAAGPLTEFGDAELGRLIDTNLIAPIALSRELLPVLRAAVRARIVNIGSLVGDIAMPYFTAYSASKFGLRGASNALRRELRDTGIGITYAAPSGIHTPGAARVADYTAPFGMRLDPPERIAAEIWDAVARGSDSVYPRGRQRLFVLFERLVPSLVTRALAAQLARGGTADVAAEPDASAPRP